MGIEYDIGINIAAAVIGASLSSGLTAVKKVHRRAFSNSFWRFLEQPTVFVVGELYFPVILSILFDALEPHIPNTDERKAVADALAENIQQQETSGLMGRGDFQALATLVLKQASLGLRSRPAILFDADVRPTDETEKNLILIGGPDVNSLTRKMAPRLGCKLGVITNSSGWNTVFDARLSSEYSIRESTNDQGETVHVDYGMLARGPNPENADRIVLIMAGAHGSGTYAASEISVQAKHAGRLRREMNDSRDGFECLVRYEHVVDGRGARHPSFDLEFARPISPPP